MCLFGLCLNAHAGFPVILVSNRDEYFSVAARASSPSRHASSGDGADCEVWLTAPDGLSSSQTSELRRVSQQQKGSGVGHVGPGPTWLVINESRGTAAVVLNAGYTQGGRGWMPYHFSTRTTRNSSSSSSDNTSSSTSCAPIPFCRGHYNALWGPLRLHPRGAPDCPGMATDRRGGEVGQWQYTSNFGTNALMVRTVESGVTVCGNDLLCDEICKAPPVQALLASAVASQSGEGTTPESLRDAVVRPFCVQTPLCSTWPLVRKFFEFSRSRRVQPGLRTALFALVLLLLVCTTVLAVHSSFSHQIPSLAPSSFWQSWSRCALLSFGAALAIGFLHHWYLQSPFVNVFPWLPASWRARYGTISQTVVLVSASGDGYLYFRRGVCAEHPRFHPDPSAPGHNGRHCDVDTPSWQLIRFQVPG
eukprot:gnl/Spiro4/7446_TR3898_c0_g1_i1.p1 gnl/Spiro4/7446_TR3898_c0_g1~~gnl/Spiro4/7446_TR3898_c0_g1_i1.p1  ORF type:complete len:419 (+),score=87.15 gnl/Spiro4/7446_TR3898_c0_g1_i1:37-1293(+)